MVLFPNCKVNIGLDILRRRPDGYHDVETVMVPVPWTDVLEIVPASGAETTLTTTGRTVDCPPEKNLVMKAYRALAESVGELPPVDIYLRKIIPDGAGLGGGSADAAFTLVGLNSLFSLGLSDERLSAVASKIGADCPFFIYNRPMIATGTGTDLAPIELELPPYVAVIKPAESVPTREAYAGTTPRVPAVPLAERLAAGAGQWQTTVRNDFEDSIFPKLPECDAIKRRLLGMGALYASLSGSGSAVYGLFDSDILADAVAASFPSCAVFVGRLN